MPVTDASMTGNLVAHAAGVDVGWESQVEQIKGSARVNVRQALHLKQRQSLVHNENLITPARQIISMEGSQTVHQVNVVLRLGSNHVQHDAFGHKRFGGL